MFPRRLPRRTGIRVAELSAFGRARRDLFGTCCQVANSGKSLFRPRDLSSRRRAARARILCFFRQTFRGAPGGYSPPLDRTGAAPVYFIPRHAGKMHEKVIIQWANHLGA